MEADAVRAAAAAAEGVAVKGLRKLAFGFTGLLFLLCGLALCLRYAAAGQVIFSAYATALVTIVTAVVLGNVGEHLSKRGQGGTP